MDCHMVCRDARAARHVCSGRAVIRDIADDAANVMKNRIRKCFDIDTQLAALEIPRLESAVPTGFHRAMDVFGVHLLMLRAEKAVLWNGMLEFGFEIQSIAAVGLSLKQNEVACP